MSIHVWWHADSVSHAQSAAMGIELNDFSWERMIAAVEAVRERARRAAAALEQAGIPYAVAGGNAVAAWVSRVDRAAVRNTQDVDILVRRSDFAAVKRALESVGFHHHTIMDVECFIDGDSGRARDAVNLLFASEKVRPNYAAPSADVTESERAEEFMEPSNTVFSRGPPGNNP